MLITAQPVRLRAYGLNQFKLLLRVTTSSSIFIYLADLGIKEVAWMSEQKSKFQNYPAHLEMIRNGKQVVVEPLA
jgi:hypothetical protein